MTDLSLRWDLEKILKDGTFEDLLNDYFTKLNEIIKLYEDDIFSHKEKLLRFHLKSLKSSAAANKVFNYVSCKHHENLNNHYWFSQYQNLKKKSVPYHQKMSDFHERAVKNRDLILEYLQDERLHPWKRFYYLIFRKDNHQIPSIVKKFLATHSPMDDSYEQIFTLIRDNELPIKPAKDANRRLHKIKNYDAFIQTQYHDDRVLRKNAYYSWFNAITAMEETFAKLLYFKILKQNLDAKNYNFKNFYELKIFEDEIDSAFIPYLYKKVSRFHSEFKKFKKIRQQVLKKTYGLRSIKPWDRRIPVIKTNHERIEIEEAKRIAIEALSVFGEKYVSNIKKAFDEQWIDWEAREGKISGAYCIGGSYGVESKYILMNYYYRMQDVFTLVHELGHAMHALEYCEAQKVYANSTIFIAEIPSSLNEIMLSFYLIETYKDDPIKQFEIYDNLLDNFFNSTISQIILSDFEYEINKLVNSGRIINASSAKLIYKAKQEKYQGNRITKPLSHWKDLALAGILTVPHFYTEDFYVYKYAVGQIVSILIAVDIYRNKDKEALDNFFKFLRSGNSISNIETLQLLNIDLEKSSLWTKAKNEVQRWIKEYEELSKRL